MVQPPFLASDAERRHTLPPSPNAAQLRFLHPLPLFFSRSLQSLCRLCLRSPGRRQPVSESSEDEYRQPVSGPLRVPNENDCN